MDAEWLDNRWSCMDMDVVWGCCWMMALNAACFSLCVHKCKQTYRHTDRQAGRQTHRQADRHTDKCFNMYVLNMPYISLSIHADVPKCVVSERAMSGVYLQLLGRGDRALNVRMWYCQIVSKIIPSRGPLLCQCEKKAEKQMREQLLYILHYTIHGGIA